MKRAVFAVLGLVLSSLLAVGAVEGFLRITGKDWALVHKALYFQQTDVAVHRISPDPFLHFELRPGARSSAAHAVTGRTYHVEINSHGARGEEVPLEKPEGTFRILFVGASTIYGYNCDDAETLPSQLELALERLGAEGGGPEGGFEVWNFGVSAYVQPQISRMARNKIRDIPGVDLVVVLFTNSGRRPFLGEGATTPEHLPLFAARDPLFLPENFPAPDTIPPGLHRFGLRSLALYRYYAAYRRGIAARQQEDNRFYRALDLKESEALQRDAAAAGVSLYFVGYPLNGGRTTLPSYAGAGPAFEAPGMNLMAPGEIPETYDVHPLPHVFADYGARIAQGLVDAGLVPIEAAAAP